MEPAVPARASAEPAFRPGDAVDRYRIVREAGRGGMGAIYLARDTVLRRMVALKVLPREFVTLREHRERFVREAQAAAKIRHPNVVAVHDVCLSTPPYIVMEYLEGETFESLLRREAPMSIEQAMEVLLPVMSAVAAAHESRVIHRDLKPANIMLTRERDGALTPKVLDFGISKVAKVTREFRAAAPRDLELTDRDAQLGTPNYMAPEQDGSHDEVGPWSDAYPLGLMLYRAVTGRLPFIGTSAQDVLYQKRRGGFTSLTTFPFGLPDGLDLWMGRALSPDPRRRFRSVREMATALLAFAPEPLRARWSPVFAPPDDGHHAPTPAHDAHAEGSLSTTGDLPPTASSTPAPAKLSRRERVLVGALAGVTLLAASLGVRTWRRDATPAPVIVQAAPPTRTEATPARTEAPPAASEPSVPPTSPAVTAAPPAVSPRPAAVAGNARPRPATVPLGRGEWVTAPQLGGGAR
ncbi:MAG: protein kinase [Polyangiales bacterium]